MAPKVQPFIRPEGRDGYTVGVRLLVGAPIMLTRYSPGEKKTASQCRELAEAHKQGLEQGLRLAANVLEGVTP